MDDLQYEVLEKLGEFDVKDCFKPCYKWMTFNTETGMAIIEI